MTVYILKEGSSLIFKIGRTKGSIHNVLKRLQTGNSQPLSVFETVETEQGSACEAFFHRRLVSRRVGCGGGWEFFKMDSDEHMRETVEEFRFMTLSLDDARRAISPFDHEQCSDDFLEPTADDRELLDRLLKLKEEQEYLKFEREIIENKLKMRIGLTSGIRGIATWKTEPKFNETCFRERDPTGYYQILERFPRIDTAAWKANSKREYDLAMRTYFSQLRKLLLQKSR